MSERVVVACPICEGILELDAPQVGTLVDCPDCGEAYRVAAVEPLRLAYAFDSDEERSLPEDDYPRGGSAGQDGTDSGGEA